MNPSRRTLMTFLLRAPCAVSCGLPAAAETQEVTYVVSVEVDSA
jgi:hypothetical protein